MDDPNLFDTRDPLADDGDRFRAVAAILIAAFAGLLAIGSIGGGNASDDVLQEAIGANDAYAFFQAKNIRQTDYEIAADDIRIRLDDPAATMSAETRAALEQQYASYQATIARYESEPDQDDPTNPLKGEGKTELLAQAAAHIEAQALAQGKANLFDFGLAALQIAVVVMSVAILITSVPLAALSALAGLVGALFVLDGFLYLVPWPA